MNNQNKDLISNRHSKQLLSPKKDVVFQILFGEIGSEVITKNFLESILHEKITKIDLSKNPILRSFSPNGKKGILDVFAIINGNEKCNIEMQVGKQNDIIKRILYYWARTYIKDIKSGDKYDELERTIVILIADFEITELRELGLITNWKLIESDNRKVILTDLLEIDIIMLPKIHKLNNSREDKALLEWLYFLENPNSKVVDEIMEINEEIRAAKAKLEKLTEDPVVQTLLMWEEDAERRENHNKRIALEEGIKKGRANEKIEIAKKMKQLNIDIVTIIKVTGLSQEEIEHLP